MNDIRETLKDAIGPLTAPDLERDLWPAMRARMTRHAARISWFDWLIAAAAAAWAAAFPGLIPALAYYF